MSVKTRDLYGPEHETNRLAISLEFARWQLKYGSGDPDFVFESSLVGWRVANWQAERDDLDFLDDLILEERLGMGETFKDCGWRYEAEMRENV